MGGVPGPRLLFFRSGSDRSRYPLSARHSQQEVVIGLVILSLVGVANGVGINAGELGQILFRRVLPIVVLAVLLYQVPQLGDRRLRRAPTPAL